MYKFLIVILICLYAEYPNAQDTDWPNSITCIYDIFNTNYFGIYSDTSNDKALDSLVIRNTHLLLIAENKDYNGLPINEINTTVWSRYSFKELSCIKSFTFYSGVLSTGYLRHPSDMILFNICDSSVYLFGDNIERFGKVVKGALPDILKQNRMLELLDLYFNVQYTSLYKNLYNGDKMIYLIETANDFGAICNYYTENFTDNLYNNDTIRDNIETVKNILVPCVIRKNKNEVKVLTNTWNWLTGDLKHWEFIISTEGLIISDSATLLKDIGPHKLRD